jgi:hypothetical protein
MKSQAKEEEMESKMASDLFKEETHQREIDEEDE